MKQSKEVGFEMIRKFADHFYSNPRPFTDKKTGEGRVLKSCHTVRDRIISPTTGEKSPSLNETLRVLGLDPIATVNEAVAKGIVNGRPAKGGFRVSPAKGLTKSSKKDSNPFAVLDEVFGS